MPSSPKISKQLMLKTAFEMLCEEGYSAINIKTLAKKIGCSTQPISRHFGSMDGLRKELLDYCIGFLESFFQIEGDTAFDIVMGISRGYIEVAFQYPNLYKYFYMSEQDGERMSMIAQTLRLTNYNKLIERLEKEHQIGTKEAAQFVDNMTFYVHGIASYVAVDFGSYTKEEMCKRIEKAGESFLTQAKSIN
ncbi:MAG: TetR/AcrR family transcriptional regulator [Lachnospiraceae bacterium]|nr:TetR/AcrR family transcriptional regulator [Lachnospiraceae bacterium]